jgi:CRP/FNR family transcriptional regulator
MGARDDGIESSLRATPLFCGLGADARRMLARQVKRVRFERGANVWHAGEDAAWMAVIASGLVKIVQPAGGILAIFGSHETFGELAVVSGSTYSADAIAATRSVELLCVEASAVRAAARSDMAFARAMSHSLVGHGRVLHEKIRIMSAGCVERRLAMLLHHLLDRFGDELEDGSTVIQIALSRAELASLVAATIETTIRIMSRWHKQGIVSTLDDGFLVPSPSRLAQILGALPRRDSSDRVERLHVAHDESARRGLDDPLLVPTAHRTNRGLHRGADDACKLGSR